MRKFHDYHETKVAMSNTTAQLSSGSGVLASTAISCAGFGRARFVFVLGATPGAGATFSASIWCGSSSLAILTPVTLSIATAAAAGSGVIVVDLPITGSNTWLCVSDAKVGGSAWDVMGIVDLYNCYIHPPVTLSPQQIITI
jgi:hypothetical protein